MFKCGYFLVSAHEKCIADYISSLKRTTNLIGSCQLLRLKTFSEIYTSLNNPCLRPFSNLSECQLSQLRYLQKINNEKSALGQIQRFDLPSEVHARVVSQPDGRRHPFLE